MTKGASGPFALKMITEPKLDLMALEVGEIERARAIRDMSG
jgi:hypothetical protein